MRFLRISILFIFAVLVFTGHASCATGDLQIFCVPGVTVNIDGRIAGISTDAMKGLYVEGLSVGRHEVTASRSGYEPETQTVQIEQYITKTINIEFKELREVIKQLPTEKTDTVAYVGTLILRSAPVGADVYIDGIKKGVCDLEISNVRAGSHEIKFVNGKDVLSGNFALVRGDTLKLQAHFIKGIIINITEIEQKEAQQKQHESMLKLRLEEEKRAELERIKKKQEEIDKALAMQEFSDAIRKAYIGMANAKYHSAYGFLYIENPQNFTKEVFEIYCFHPIIKDQRQSGIPFGDKLLLLPQGLGKYRLQENLLTFSFDCYDYNIRSLQCFSAPLIQTLISKDKQYVETILNGDYF